MVAIKTGILIGVNLQSTKEKAFSSLDPQMLGCQVRLQLYSSSSIGVIFLDWTALHVHMSVICLS